MRSILGRPIQSGALFLSIAGEITSRDTPEEETTTSSDKDNQRVNTSKGKKSEAVSQLPL